MRTFRAAVAGAALAGVAAPAGAQPPAPLPAPQAAADLYPATPAAPPAAAAAGTAPSATAPAAAPEALPIDLPTALRLVDAQSPTVGLAQARVAEAVGRLDQVRAGFLPTITAGAAYFRHDGQDQNRRGDVFSVSRSNTFAGGGLSARFDTSDALFLPLAARRMVDAATASARGVRNDEQLDAASAYLTLLREYAALAINADTLARAEQMLDRSEAAQRAGLAKTPGDINRARTEVELRREERAVIRGRIGAASARLARVLFLPDTVDLLPADKVVVPITLVPSQSLDNLVGLGLSNRPELAAARSVAGAADQRLRQAQVDPFVPKVAVDYRGGGFAGARNADWSDLRGQQELNAQVYWQLDGLGFGNRAQVRVRRAELDQTRFREMQVQAQVRAEVLESAKLASARFASLTASQEAVRQGTELYRKLLDTSFGMVDRRQYDALEPLLAIQALNQARVRYLEEVIEYNRAQFQLYTAIGQPPAAALAAACPVPVDVPVLPPSPGVKAGEPGK